jgi:hypothetical protein
MYPLGLVLLMFLKCLLGPVTQKYQMYPLDLVILMYLKYLQHLMYLKYLLGLVLLMYLKYLQHLMYLMCLYLHLLFGLPIEYYSQYHLL